MTVFELSYQRRGCRSGSVHASPWGTRKDSCVARPSLGNGIQRRVLPCFFQRRATCNKALKWMALPHDTIAGVMTKGTVGTSAQGPA